jgi:hypothetical protein
MKMVPLLLCEGAWTVLLESVDQYSKSDCWAAPIVFGPRTLRRTWGTRPISLDSVMGPISWALF